MNKFLKAMWGTVFGMAFTFGVVGKAQAAITIDPGTTIYFVVGSSGQVTSVEVDGVDVTGSFNPAVDPIVFTATSDGTVAINIQWTSSAANGTNRLVPNLPLTLVQTGGTGTAVITSIGTPDPTMGTSTAQTDSNGGGTYFQIGGSSSKLFYRNYSIVFSDVGEADPTIVKSQMGFSGKAGSGTTSINASLPEPATIVLLGSGLAGIAAARRNQKRRKAA